METIQQNQIEELLKGLNPRYKAKLSEGAPSYCPVMGGCAVVIVNPDVWQWGHLPPFSVGICDGAILPHETGSGVSITFNYSAFKGANSCSCSGGPGSIFTPVECLRFTGLEVECTFWRWRDGLQGAGRGVSYREYVPLFVWYQSEFDALVKPELISHKRYCEMWEVLPPIEISTDSWFKAPYTDETGKIVLETMSGVFACSEPYTHTKETVVLSCFYKVTYKTPNKETGYYEDYNVQYFEQKMLVYTPDFKPFFDTLNHCYGKEYQARPYYKHTKP